MKKPMFDKENQVRSILVVGTITILGLLLLFLMCLFLGRVFGKSGSRLSKFLPTGKVEAIKVSEMFLTPNEYSRPQLPLEKVNGIVIHYTANPGTDAKANRDYFEGLKDNPVTSASSHYVIGLDGKVIQCIPLDEVAYASNHRNKDTIAIECCHLDETGEFNEETYQSLIHLTAWLCGQYNLKEEDILRHYDVTGKNCPKYFVEKEEKWEQFKKDVFTYIKEHAIKEE